MRVSLRHNKGFSLVELMVVVAIIGILAAIAVPNYQKFAAKSKQSEAKANLSALYSAEMAFRSEWQGFHSRFSVIGYAPTGNLRYKHGFSGDNGPPDGPAPNNFGTTFTGQPGIAVYIETNGYCGSAVSGGGAGACAEIIAPLAPDALTAGVVNNPGGTPSALKQEATLTVTRQWMCGKWTKING